MEFDLQLCLNCSYSFLFHSESCDFNHNTGGNLINRSLNAQILRCMLHPLTHTSESYFIDFVSIPLQLRRDLPTRHQSAKPVSVYKDKIRKCYRGKNLDSEYITTYPGVTKT